MPKYKALGYDIPVDQSQWMPIDFSVTLDAIKKAPRPVTLGEVAYHLTGHKGFQHLINPQFSGYDNATKRMHAGLYVAKTENHSKYWAVRGTPAAYFYPSKVVRKVQRKA